MIGIERIIIAPLAGIGSGAVVYAISYGLGFRVLWPGAFVAFASTIALLFGLPRK